MTQKPTTVHLKGDYPDLLSEAKKLVQDQKGGVVRAEIKLSDINRLFYMERQALIHTLQEKGIELHIAPGSSKSIETPEQSTKRRAVEIQCTKVNFAAEFREVLAGTWPERIFLDENSEVDLFEIFPDLEAQLSICPDIRYLPVRVAFLNLKAVKMVMVENPEFFPPEARENPFRWLLVYLKQKAHDSLDPSDFKLSEIRYGLLSGFDRESVLQYPAFLDASETLNSLLAIIPEERKGDLQRFQARLMSKDEMEAFLSSLSQQREGITIRLTESEKKIIIAKQSFSNVDIGYITFDENAPQRFRESIERRRKQCQIIPPPKLEAFLRGLEAYGKIVLRHRPISVTQDFFDRQAGISHEN